MPRQELITYFSATGTTAKVAPRCAAHACFPWRFRMRRSKPGSARCASNSGTSEARCMKMQKRPSGKLGRTGVSIEDLFLQRSSAQQQEATQRGASAVHLSSPKKEASAPASAGSIE